MEAPTYNTLDKMAKHKADVYQACQALISVHARSVSCHHFLHFADLALWKQPDDCN